MTFLYTNVTISDRCVDRGYVLVSQSGEVSSSTVPGTRYDTLCISYYYYNNNNEDLFYTAALALDY
jgi:hypothetical protein